VFYLASNTKGQPRDWREDWNDASERKQLINTVERECQAQFRPPASANGWQGRPGCSLTAVIAIVRGLTHGA
jgi:hypothetical protein